MGTGSEGVRGQSLQLQIFDRPQDRASSQLQDQSGSFTLHPFTLQDLPCLTPRVSSGAI